MEAAGSRVGEVDWLGASGGQLAIAFGAGCAACWGFIQTILVGPMKKQIEELKDECEERDRRSAQRISQLETMLLLHGPGPLRQQLQAVISEARVEGDLP